MNAALVNIRLLSHWQFLAVLALALVGISHAPDANSQTECGTVEPCVIDNGDYYLALPENWDGNSPLKSLMFYHGHASSARSIIDNRKLIEPFTSRGYAVIAPNGAVWPERNIRAWPARPDLEDRRDDVAFSLAVLDDVAKKVPLDPDQIYASGFSAGGSMAWMLACYEGTRFAGIISVAGALRRPVPDDQCDGGATRLLQIHGFSDLQVPLEGRAIGDWHQGDAFESLELLRNTNQCQSLPSKITFDEPYRCRYWDDCDTAKPIALCLHDGGHSLPHGWTDLVLDWMETATE